MLRVVQTAAWDSEPPHMSGYPHLPPPPPQYPPPHAHRQPQHSYHQDPQWHPYPPLAPPPLPPPHGTLPPPPPSSALWRTPLRNVRAAGASTQGAAWPVHRPMWHRSRRCVGGCGTNPIVRPPLRFSMCGLYGTVSHMYVDTRSRLPNVLHLGGPPCVSTGSAGDRRDAGRSASSRNGRNQHWCHGGAAGCCTRCSPRVLLRHL